MVLSENIDIIPQYMLPTTFRIVFESTFPHQKKALLSTRQKRFFQRNPSLTTGEIHLRWVKSRCDEIPLRGVTDGFHFTVRQRRTISPKASAFDFTEAEPRFHCLYVALLMMCVCGHMAQTSHHFAAQAEIHHQPPKAAASRFLF